MPETPRGRHKKEDPREVLLALPHVLEWLVIGLIQAGHTTHEGGAKVLRGLAQLIAGAADGIEKAGKQKPNLR